MELERRVHAILEENELLQNTVDELREKTMVLERQWSEKELQVHTQTRLPATENQPYQRLLLIRKSHLL